ncbi:hypothetical protein [Bacillus marinisedimentorum]|uniref:hypothetical protein n=1 Tax=Bacillus marinisedimentorum TaxID=1821260 RepID=UPI0012FF8372|nr:hypothetical protein [Bacillus marinisedimentorum]
MKKYIFVLLFCAVFLLTGFNRADYYITVCEDESTDVKMVATVANKYSMAEVEKYIIENFYLNLKGDGIISYDYELYEQEEEIIIEIRVNYPDFHSNLDLIHFGLFDIGGNSSASVRQLPFYKKGSYDAVMAIPEESIKGYVNQSFFQENENFRVLLSLPFKVISHNGNYDGETLVWKIDPYKENHLKFTYVKNELYKPVLFILSIGVIIAVILIKKKSQGKKTKTLHYHD